MTELDVYTYLVDKPSELVLQTHDLAEPFLQSGGKLQQPQSVACGGRVEHYHLVVQSLHQPAFRSALGHHHHTPHSEQVRSLVTISIFLYCRLRTVERQTGT